MECWGPEFLASLHDSSTPSFQPDLLVREIFEVDALPDFARGAVSWSKGRKRRFGCSIHAPFCSVAVFLGRWIEIRAAGIRNDRDIAIGLTSGRDRPVDLPFVENVHVVIDHDHPLHI